MEKKEKKEKKRMNDLFPTYTVGGAIAHGDWATRLSMLIMGFGCMIHRQLIKGLIMLALECAYVLFMVKKGAH